MLFKYKHFYSCKRLVALYFNLRLKTKKDLDHNFLYAHCFSSRTPPWTFPKEMPSK